MLRNLAVFLLAGGLLYVVIPYGINFLEEEKPDRILLTSQDIEQLRNGYLEKTRRLPTQEEMDALIQSRVYETILTNEAIKRELYLSDAVIRERLVLNMTFLEQGAYDIEQQSAEEREALFQKALDMGMLETDVVVRKRLRERMEKIIARSVDYPDKSDLEQYLENNRERFGLGKRVHVFHAYFNKSDIDKATVDALYQQWRQGEVSDEALLAKADRAFVEPDQALSEYSLTRLFGNTRAKKLYAATGQETLDIQESAAGFHIIRVDKISHSAGNESDYMHLKDRLVQEYMRDQEQKVLLDQLESWRSDYDVFIDYQDS